MPVRDSTWWLAGGIAWLSAVIAGCAWMLDYATTPGASGKAAPSWPANSELSRPNDTPSLVMFLHPRCPCSRASVAELEELLSRAGEEQPIAVTILFAELGSGDDATTSKLWARASAIAGAKVAIDTRGTEAARFGAKTSGHTFLYGANGKLEFSGGITRARGETGANLGRTAILAHLDGTPRSADARRAYASVFGCALADRETR